MFVDDQSEISFNLLKMDGIMATKFRAQMSLDAGS